MNQTEYANNHQDKVSLLIHIVAVPLFIAGTLYLLYQLISGEFLTASIGFGLMGISLALQGIAHKREPVPPAPFKHAGDFISRIFVEQFYRFPRFVLNGQWWQNYSNTDVES